MTRGTTMKGTRLSVNLNKVALLRNTRDTGEPSVMDAAKQVIAAGAHGITVHPRPDGRHIRPGDVRELAAYVRDVPGIELNVEGNPYPDFMELVRAAQPHQCTLVPDAPDAVTSDHGWNLLDNESRLREVVGELRSWGIRVSIFMDADSSEWVLAHDLGADRVELYTEPYAKAHVRGGHEGTLALFAGAARAGQEAGLGINAGHDLNLRNLGAFCTIARIEEVSIGHALISDALRVGYHAAVRAYLDVLSA